MYMYTYTHTGHEGHILCGLNLSVKPGPTVGIVGESKHTNTHIKYTYTHIRICICICIHTHIQGMKVTFSVD